MTITATTTQISLSFPNAAALSAATVVEFADGEWAYTADTKQTWRLDRTAMSGGIPTSNGWGRWLPFNGLPNVTGEQVVLIYKPGVADSGYIFGNPWNLAQAIFDGGLIVDVYVDCSLVSPAPWPVDIFLVGTRFHQSPITSAPAILALTPGTNPSTGLPSNGALMFIQELDGVTVINQGSSPGYTMVQCGEIFGQQFVMRNNAQIVRANDAAPLALGIDANTTFELQIDKCSDPFPNMADPTAFNVQCNGDVSRTYKVLITDALPIDESHPFQLPSFQNSGGATLALYYDDTVPSSALVETDWTGAVNRFPLTQSTTTSQSFVFQPGGTAGGNVYTTEAALASATSSLDGVPYSIFMDFSRVGGTYVVTTVGAWALGPNGTWDDGGMGYAISFEHGTTLPHPPVTLSGALTWQTKQAIDVCSPAPAQHGYTAFRDATIAICYAAGALINSQSGSYALYFSDSAYAQRAGGTGFVFHASGGFLNVYANDFSYFGPGAVDTTLTGVAAINIGSPSAVIDVSLYPFIVVQGLFVDLFGGAVTTIPAVGDATGALLYSGRELYTSNGTSWGLALNVLPSSIYVVSPNGPYTSINAAITQAVADGHTDQTNAATVLIVPNPGGWNENVLLHGGVNLQGQWGGESYSVQINGKLSYTPGPVALSEKVNVSGVYVHALGEPCVEILGTNAGQLWVYNCQLSQYDALFPNVSMNGATGSNLFLQDCDGNVHAGGTAYDIEAGSCYAVNTDLSSGHALRGAHVGATGYFEGRNSTHLVGRGPDAINIAAGGTVFLFGANVTQLQSGGSSAVLAGGTLTAINTLFATPVAAGGYAAQGTGTFNYGGCFFEGSPNVQNTLTVTAIPSTPTLVP